MNHNLVPWPETARPLRVEPSGLLGALTDTVSQTIRFPFVKISSLIFVATSLALGACGDESDPAGAGVSVANESAADSVAPAATESAPITTEVPERSLNEIATECSDQIKPETLDDFIVEVGYFTDPEDITDYVREAISDEFEEMLRIEPTNDGSFSVALYAGLLKELDAEFFDCVNGEIMIPDRIIGQMESTRALDGQQEAEWDDKTIQWNYHPDSGLRLTAFSE
jgi:hypothetical protein